MEIVLKKSPNFSYLCRHALFINRQTSPGVRLQASKIFDPSLQRENKCISSFHFISFTSANDETPKLLTDRIDFALPFLTNHLFPHIWQKLFSSTHSSDLLELELRVMLFFKHLLLKPQYRVRAA